MSTKPSPKILDIVIQVASGNLSFLNGWTSFLAPYHLIIVQTTPGPKLTAPAGFDVEIHSISEVQKLLGQDFWCLSTGDILSRSLGYLLSKKKYIFSLGKHIR